ncbi:MAG: hypothetical protein EA379_12505 [Phycisphaerales bacterium]|nr:MAG: hypothetical protein EA379_12505 [Phycisphaerales bacterium]
MTTGNGHSSGGDLALCVVLGGGLQSSPLQSLCHISVLDLPITPGVSVLDHVLGRVEEAHAAASRSLPVRVVYGDPVPRPSKPAARQGLEIEIVREANRWRGPAGVLLDVCDHLPSDANILVIEGARWYGAPIGPLVEAHAQRGAEVTIAQAADRSPAGVYVIRRSSLDPTPRLGFMDLKEQLLGRLLAEGRRIVVHTLATPGTMPLRSLEGYLRAGRVASGSSGEWSVLDPDCEVGEGAVVVSSVIMRGARIEPGAVVARSIVLEGAVIQSGAETVDSVVQPGAVLQPPDPFSDRTGRRGSR